MTFKELLNVIIQRGSLSLTQMKKNALFTSIGVCELKLYTNKLSNFLLNYAKNKSSMKVLTLCENGVEWNIIDLGIMQAGFVHVPIVPSIDHEKISLIIEKVRPNLIITSSKVIFQFIKTFCGSTPIFLLEEIFESQNNIELNDKEIKDEQLASIFTTSGSSGNLKGVLHNHKFIIDNAIEAANFYQFKPHHKSLSILPIQYAFERMYNYIFMYSGMHIHYANPFESLLSNVLYAKADVICIVPALLEQILEDSSNDSQEFDDYIQTVNPTFICSGAPIHKTLSSKILEKNLKIHEMYGSTETLIVSGNTESDFRENTSGKIIDPRRVKINSGVLEVKTDMMGYFEGFKQSNNFQNGWIRTDDLATISHEFLIIKGRANHMIKNSFGVFLNLEELENNLKSHLELSRLVIFEENGALNCIVEAENHKFSYVVNKLKKYNLKQKDGEKIYKFAVSSSWSPESGELTSSFKIIRKEIIHKYKKQLKLLS